MKRQFRSLFLPCLVGMMGFWDFTRAAGDTLVIAQGADLAGVDCQRTPTLPFANVLFNIFDTMYHFNPDGSLVPRLVTAKSVNATTWDLTVRPGVKFHNGEDLDAQTIKWNFDRVTDSVNPLPIRQFWENIVKTEVSGSMTLRVFTKFPFPAFLTRMTYLCVMPRHYVSENGDAYLKVPIGTGPYRFVRWVKDQNLELEANPTYWGGEPKIKKVIFRPIPENSSRVAELISGGVDLISLTPQAIATVKASNMAEAFSIPSIRNINIILNTRDGVSDSPMLNPKVRLALNYATDKKAIVQNVLGGFAAPVGCILNRLIFGYDQGACTPYEYNPERAKQLLKEAGYEGGFAMTLGSTNGGSLNDRQVAEAIVGQWAKIGVKAELRVVESSTLTSAIYSRKIPTDALLIGSNNSEFDADQSLYGLFYTGAIKGGPPASLYTYIKVPAVDPFILKGQRTLDQAERKEAYSKALKLLRAEVPYVYLYQLEDIYGVSKRLVWKPRPDQRLFLTEMEFKGP